MHSGFLLKNQQYSAIGYNGHGELGIIGDNYVTINTETYYAPDSSGFSDQDGSKELWTDVLDVAAKGHHTCMIRGEKDTFGDVYCVGKMPTSN